MNHLQIELTCMGDRMTAISQSINIAKAINENLILSFRGYEYRQTISPDSNTVEASKLADAKIELEALKSKSNQ